MTTSSTPSTGARATPDAASQRPFPLLGLLILSLGVFLAISSETIPTGLLPEMSDSLGVTESQVGLLVSIFAATVVVTSTPLTALTLRVPRRTLLIVVLVVLGLSNILTASVSSYALVVVSRVLGGLAHGVFWSMVPAYAARLVEPRHLSRAVSITLAGSTIALVLGVPLGTALGHAVGWRWAFAAIGIALLVGAVAVRLWLPQIVRGVPTHTDAIRTGRDASVVPVIVVCVAVAVIMVGNYAFYTYIAPFLTDRLAVPTEYVSVVLFVYGGAGALGLLLTGTVFGRRNALGLVIGLAASAVSVGVLALALGGFWTAIVALALWGAAFGMVPPLLQTRMLQTASDRFRDTASAVYTTAFNTGISGGALLGAVLLSSSGLDALPVANVALTVAGLAVVVGSVLWRRRAA